MIDKEIDSLFKQVQEPEEEDARTLLHQYHAEAMSIAALPTTEEEKLKRIAEARERLRNALEELLER